jgi:two-component system, chemotaxis family, sensor kinase CheA
MDDLIQDFIAETREMLEALGGEIVAWEATPDDKARLDEIFRFVHTVKGNCGFFDLPRIRALSHAAEDALAAVRAGRRTACPQLVSAVLAVIDRLSELIEALETGQPLASEEDGELIAALCEDAAAEKKESSDAAPAAASRSHIRTIRLPVDLLDRMMSGISDLVLARNDLARRLRHSEAGLEVDGAFERVSGTIADLRDAITRTRMQPIEQLFAPLPRMVRDLAAETGKAVSLEIDGGDVELDREMIEMIRDPLTHIVRNAIDHGIEDAAGRRAAGKADSGSLSVCARQAGNQIHIEICDDGRGIDAGSLVRKAIAAGILDAERAERMTADQKNALIFEPGLSTASHVTAISGRGVGMDVVRANIERIGGLVDIHSREGEGVRLTLRVPLTLTIIPALTIQAGGWTYALPRSALEEIVRVKDDMVRIEQVGGARIVTIRGRRMPLVSLPMLLGAQSDDPSGQTLIVLKPAGTDGYALAVDQVHEHQELVVRPAAPQVMAAGLYAGTTIGDDGRPVLLLDPPGIAARVGLSLERRELHVDAPTPESQESMAEAAPAILFKTLSGARRLVPVAAVERIVEVPPRAVILAAGRLQVTLGDQLVPLLGCGDTPPDRAIRLLCLTDGRSGLAYAIDEVVDVVSTPGEIVLASEPGEVAAAALVDGEPAELLDLHWLFSHCVPTDGGTGRSPVCALPLGDPWMDTILRPLVESCGYQVVRAGESGSEAPDIVIVAAETPLSAEPRQRGRVLRLRTSVDPLGEGDDSIHRYDRAALLGALARTRKKLMR